MSKEIKEINYRVLNKFLANFYIIGQLILFLRRNYYIKLVIIWQRLDFREPFLKHRRNIYNDVTYDSQVDS